MIVNRKCLEELNQLYAIRDKIESLNENGLQLKFKSNQYAQFEYIDCEEITKACVRAVRDIWIKDYKILESHIYVHYDVGVGMFINDLEEELETEL